MTTPLYLIPGTMCDARLWGRVLPYLPGFAVSHCDFTKAESLEDMVDAVLRQAPADPCHLVGFSLGGYVAMMTAIRSPQRFKSLTVISASPYGLGEDEKLLRRQSAEMLMRHSYKGMSKTRLAQLVHESHLECPDIVGTILQMEKDLGQDVLLRQLTAPTERPDISGVLGSLAIPVHFIIARDDQIVPLGVIEGLAAKSVNITLHTIEGSGHMIPLEAPAALVSLIQDIPY